MRSALILIAVLNGFAFSAYAQSTQNTLSDLPTAVRDDIARVCLPVQYQQGAAAYRNCVTQEIASRESVSDVDVVLDSYTSLSFDDRYAIQQICAGNDTDSIDRACMSEQISALTALPVPNLSELSSDELYVMQQTCFNAQSSQGAAAFRQCQIDEIRSVNDIAKPNYAALGSVERNALQLKCSATQSRLAAYRDCLSNGTASTKDGQASLAVEAIADSSASSISKTRSIKPQLPAATAVRVSNIEVAINEPAIEAALPATTEKLVGEIETTSSDDQANTAVRTKATYTSNVENLSTPSDVETPRAQTTNEQADVQANEQAVESEQSNDVTTITGTDSTYSTDSTGAGSLAEAPSGNAVALEQLKEKLSGLTTNASDTFNGLSNQGKLLLAAILAMPVALWLLLRGRRRRGDEYSTEGAYSREDLKRRVHAYPDDYDSADEDDDHDPLSATWEAEADSLFDEPEPVDTERVIRAEPAPSSPRYEQSPPGHAFAANKVDDLDETLQPTQQSVTDPSRSAGFAGWLHNQPQPDQQSLAIEFLIYWMAYSDERYEPSLKQRIFQKQDPNSHDIVKRWVLKEDIHAFADVVDWLQRHTTNIQKEQIVRLLMVLLINGDSPTPLQNTLLRFLGDVFYLNNPSLEALFEEEYGVSLPNIPRVDRMAWWERQSPGAVSLWDVRTLNASDLITRNAAQLGVNGEARVEHVEIAYERAAMRCRPENFDHLGEREHQLISSRRMRLTQARDELLEALA